jgi:hypothetical protein
MTDRTRLVADLYEISCMTGKPLGLGDAVACRQASAELARMDELERDAARYAWLKARLHSADFTYQTADNESISVLVFDVTGRPVSANLDATIDAALAHSTGEAAKGKDHG